MISLEIQVGDHSELENLQIAIAHPRFELELLQSNYVEIGLRVQDFFVIISVAASGVFRNLTRGTDPGIHFRCTFKKCWNISIVFFPH